MDESTNHFKGTNLSKFKSRSHKSFEKLRKFDTEAPAQASSGEKPKHKFSKVKEELERLGINKNKKKDKSKNPEQKNNLNHVSFNEEKKNKKNRVKIIEDDYYNINKNKPHSNFLNEHTGDRTKGKKAQPRQEVKPNNTQKKGKKKGKKNNGFAKSTSLFS